MPNLNSPILTGDVSGGLHTTSVDKLKGQPVSSTAPTNGQTLVWNGSAWAPATPNTGGGGGANGLTYYLRQDVDADAPTTNLPGTPKQLGRTGATGQTSVTSGTLTAGVWTLLGGYVSESVPIDPNITAIPGGLWDFNVWALGTANANAGTVIRAKVYTYDGSNAPTLLGTSGEQVINNVSAQFSLSVLVPQTTVQLTTRIYVEIEVKAAANNHTATLEFGDGTPSHVHTSLPLVGGTGLWKNVSGVLQSPASLLVDADVDAAAAIAQSKIANLTTDLGNKAGSAQVNIYTTPGSHTWAKPAGAKVVYVTCIGGGGGGGSGRKGSSNTQPTPTVGTGGGGGAGGGFSTRIFDASILGATEPVVVGAGGAGGASVSVANTNGNTGGNGVASSFNDLISAAGGIGASAATTSSGGGGAVSSQRAMFPGGAGGTGQAATNGSTGLTSYAGAGGGGGGGGMATAPNNANGGTGAVALGSFSAGGQAGGGAPGLPGGAGVGTSATNPMPGGGGGGGGAITSGNGGAGGVGGNYGGGGGGGGGCNENGSSGAGGAGAGGAVIVVTYF